MGNTAYVALGSPLTGHPVAGVCTPSSSGGNNGRSRRHGGVLPSPRRLPTRDSGCRSTAVTPMHGHTQKSAKTSAATPECIATRQLIHHARSRSMEDEAMPSSPLRSRRQLPSVCLSVDMDYELEGRDGIVYILNMVVVIERREGSVVYRRWCSFYFSAGAFLRVRLHWRYRFDIVTGGLKPRAHLCIVSPHHFLPSPRCSLAV